MRTQVYDGNVMNIAEKNDLSEYMRVCSSVFFIMQLDRRNSFRPFTVLGRVTGSLGRLIVIESISFGCCVLFYFLGFFSIFLDLF